MGRRFTVQVALSLPVASLAPVLALFAACGSEDPSPLDAAVDGGAGADGATVDLDGGGRDGSDLPGACTSTATPGAGVVFTTLGAVLGVESAGVVAHLGIPYAAPPVGDRRWTDPEPHPCWRGLRPAATFGAKCTQLENNVVIGDEDCLTLNIWANAAAATLPRPVMVFIHGGGNSIGSASVVGAGGLFIYDGADLSRDADVVVVTLQYRIGAFGYFAHPDLSAERQSGVSGNYGVRDLIFALGFVRENAAAFGGDPANITLFGESAGAVNVCTLLSAPSAAGRFQRAIMESGSCGLVSMTERMTRTAPLVANAGCAADPSPVACLRSKTQSEIVLALPETVSVAGGALDIFGAAFDGDLLPASPIEVINMAAHHDVPVIVGANRDETGRDVPMIRTCAELEAAVRRQFMGLADRVLATYPCAAYPTPRAALVALTSDARFICGSRRVARALDNAGSSPVFRYFFTHALSRGPGAAAGAFHGLELVYVFGNGIASLGPADLSLSNNIQGYWGTFARQGDPNGGQRVLWPNVATSTASLMILDEPAQVAADPREVQCNFWDTLGS